MLAELFSEEENDKNAIIEAAAEAAAETAAIVTSTSWGQKLTSAFGKLSKRVSTLTASDLATIIGIDRNFSQREMEIIQSLLQGKAVSHHMEDEYFKGIAGASGFLARLGEDIIELEEAVENNLLESLSAVAKDKKELKG